MMHVLASSGDCVVRGDTVRLNWTGDDTVRIRKLVGGPGFEPGASRSRTVRAAKLRQPPTLRARAAAPRAGMRLRFYWAGTSTFVSVMNRVAVASATRSPCSIPSTNAMQ